MRISENMLKWMMRFYPPMFFQRIWVIAIHKNFRAAEVRVRKSFLTANLGGATFGGTLFAASDPFYALLFGGALRKKGFNISVWLKSAQIAYLKPARTHLYFKIEVSDEMLEEAMHALREKGKFVKAYPVEMFDKNQELCVSVQNEIHIRNLEFTAA